MDSKKRTPVRWEYWKILIAMAVLVVTSLVYYFYVRNETLKQAQKRAEFTLKYTDTLIRSQFGKVETVVDAMQLVTEYAVDDPDEMFIIARRIVESSPHIKSAAVAFNEFYFPQKGRWFEAAAGYFSGMDSLIVDQIGCESHDYTKMEWYEKGLISEDGVWSDPYNDLFSNGSLITTYSLPVHDKNNKIVGVICADISLDTLAKLFSSIKLYPNGYSTMVTNSGMEIIPPPDKKLPGEYHTFTQCLDDRNIIFTIHIPDSDLYGRLRKTGFLFVLMALLGMMAVAFIAYRFFNNLKRYDEIKIKEQHIEDELTIASTIQASLLPSDQLPKSASSVDIKGLQVSARYVGGDLYDYYVRGNKLLFCIGDVSGKGVPAAMLMSISHSLFRTLSAHSDSPDSIMTNLNNAITDNNPDIMFITMFLGIMDMTTGKISYCNAGHNPPILVRGGKAEYISTEPSLLLGVEMDTKYKAYELLLSPGDTLFLYSDGMTEAENVDKELFGEQRALEVADSFGDMSAAEQVDKMYGCVHQHVDTAEQSDDITMLSVRYIPQKKNELTLKNDMNELEKLEPFLKETFRGSNMDSSQFSQIVLALEEAIVNVIMYAYPEGETGTLTLKVEVPSDEMINMEISDFGVPFNPLKHEDADLDVPLDKRKIGGLGIHLIKQIMDRVDYSYSNGMNILRMVKSIG